MGAVIVTGYTGERHITPAMDASIYRGVFGDDSCILGADDACAGSMPDINSFTVQSGVVSVQGYQVEIEQETLAVDTCATGYTRIDLVCVRYQHDNDSLIDSAELIILKGDTVESWNTPIAPSYNDGKIQEGATVVDVPLYQITFDGANATITTVAPLNTTLDECVLSASTITLWKSILGIS